MRRLDYELALAKRRPWRDWPGWFWFHMVKRPYYAYMLHRRRKLGTYREGMPPSDTATRVRGDMLAGALPAKRIPKDTVN
ncbi:Uncharacterized protein MLTONO_p0574 (plasmid) [Mesorhizobium loti]|nr:Uncharacterized protein MLTONO_p0574 [Mesorhizobium loti]